MNRWRQCFLVLPLAGAIFAGCGAWTAAPAETALTSAATAAWKGWDAVSSESLLAHLAGIKGIRHPAADPENLARAQAYIVEQFRASGWAVTLQPFTLGGETFENVIATREGTLFPGERILLTAHFDTVAVSPGGDDNGSGVAVMLELAGILRTAAFERTLQFVAFNLEEFGTVGSREFVNQAQADDWRIRAVINLDGVGYAGPGYPQIAPGGLEDVCPQEGNFIAVVGNDYSRAMVEEFSAGIRILGLGLPHFPLVLPGDGRDMPDMRRSDLYPFWLAGYPGILVTDTGEYRNPYYHTPGDTNKTLNPAFMADVSRAVGELIRGLAVPAG